MPTHDPVSPASTPVDSGVAGCALTAISVPADRGPWGKPMDEWTFTERVDHLLGLAAEIDGLRITKAGIDLSAHFH
jgi:hypothetical protein